MYFCSEGTSSLEHHKDVVGQALAMYLRSGYWLTSVPWLCSAPARLFPADLGMHVHYRALSMRVSQHPARNTTLPGAFRLTVMLSTQFGNKFRIREKVTFCNPSLVGHCHLGRFKVPLILRAPTKVTVWPWRRGWPRFQVLQADAKGTSTSGCVYLLYPVLKY